MTTQVDRLEPTTREVRMLLDALMYRATPETRRILMHELPAAYNAYCGREVVKVVNHDGREI